MTLLLSEDIPAVNLCALHCEIRNTEQIIASYGLVAHRIGSLGELNQVLSEHGPATMKKSFVRIKARRNENLAVLRSDVKVASFSGNHQDLLCTMYVCVSVCVCVRACMHV